MSSAGSAVGSAVRFDRYMEDALYGPAGFYTQGGQPGLHHGDFVTSPTRGKLFGSCLANYLDSVWHELGEPASFLVIEAAAGTGALCQAVLEAQPECLGSLSYLLVERSPALRRLAQERLAEMSELAELAEVAADLPSRALSVGAAADTPAPQVPVPHVIVANELLDNMPVRVLERHSTGNPSAGGADSPAADGWQELYVAPDAPPASTTGNTPTGNTTGVAEILLPAPPEAVQMANRLYPDAPVGTRLPLQVKAAVWVQRALQLLAAADGASPNGAAPSADGADSAAISAAQAGRLLLIDYGAATTAELAQRTMAGWLRSYADHRLNPIPTSHPASHATTAGRADITCDVGFDQLPAGYTLTKQADWLAANGIAELTKPAKQRWQSQLANPTSAALADRALLDEANDLTNPAGLGSFLVAEWVARLETTEPSGLKQKNGPKG